ncbi:hypothetical protein SH528x_003018 [Novipirellula sp. SH528]|uniref:hypothetical protein n=1 Tax=Novipirellula sp. SH528 TaxID=3454466 RepID=UPI003FA01D63
MSKRLAPRRGGIALFPAALGFGRVESHSVRERSNHRNDLDSRSHSNIYDYVLRIPLDNKGTILFWFRERSADSVQEWLLRKWLSQGVAGIV